MSNEKINNENQIQEFKIFELDKAIKPRKKISRSVAMLGVSIARNSKIIMISTPIVIMTTIPIIISIYVVNEQTDHLMNKKENVDHIIKISNYEKLPEMEPAATQDDNNRVIINDGSYKASVEIKPELPINTIPDTTVTESEEIIKEAVLVIEPDLETPGATETVHDNILVDGFSRLSSLEERLTDLSGLVDMKPSEPIKIEHPVVLRIAEGADDTSGFWREKGADDVQFFLIVKAYNSDTNEPIKIPIKDMDTGIESDQSTWAILIPEAEFARFSSSKSSDGVFSEPILGNYNQSTAEFDWKIQTDGTTLVNWKDYE